MDVQRFGTCFIVIGILLITHGGVEFVRANTISNVALGKNATQTDTAGGSGPERAVDADPSTCSVTASASAAWTMDLGNFYMIEEVSETRSLTQWVSSVVAASSSYTGYPATYIIGPNNGINWLPHTTTTAQLHRVEVKFDNKVQVTRVDIFLSGGAGNEKAIRCNVDGNWITLWSTTPVSSSSGVQTVSPSLETSCFSNFIGVDFQTLRYESYVDAIRLHGDKPIAPISIQLGLTQGPYQAQGIMNGSGLATWRPSDKGPYRYVRIQANPQQEPLTLCNLQVKGYLPSGQLFRIVKFITMSIPRIGTVSNTPNAIICASICQRQTTPSCVTAQFDPERHSCALFGGFEHQIDNNDTNETIVFNVAAELFVN